MPTRCALCPGPAREAVLQFTNLRRGERVWLAIPLCETHGNQIEKHLKRVIPKKLMEITPLVSDPILP
jgi:hypothetical protein